MKKSTFIYFFLIGLVIGFSASFLVTKQEPTRETLTFFPVDEEVNYKNAITKLTLLHLNDEDEYTLKWELASSLDKVTYLRHDISLLFEDGVLKDKLTTWRENSESLYVKKEIDGEDSGHYEAISFHHSENHYPNDEIKSSQRISYDQLYIIDSPLSPIEFFREPSTEQQSEGKKLLDNILNQQLHHIWQDLIAYYNIPTDKYKSIPLTKIHYFNDNPLLNLTEEQTTIIMGALWETLYKDYFLGIKHTDGALSSPIGSSIPLVLIHNSGSHIIVVFQTADGDKMQLITNLSF